MFTMKQATHKKVKVLSTTVEELKPYINTFGRLLVTPHNEIVFDVADKTFRYKPLLEHGDFVLPCCDEVWVGVNEGDITFKRLLATTAL